MIGVQVAEGVFNIGTGTGNVSVTGLMGGAKVTALKVWCNGRTTAGAGRASVQYCIGITDGANQACVTGFSKDAANPTNSKSGATDDALIWTIDNTAATDGVAVIVSLDAGGFTINVTDAFSADLEIHYLAFAGYQAKVVRTANEPATATTAATTGVGFKGNIINEIGAGSLTSYATGKQTGADFNLLDGWAVTNPAGTLRQGLNCVGSDDNVATTSARQYFRSSAEVGAMLDSTASATPKSRWAFTSFDNDGFTETYNVVVGSGTRNHFALVLGGGLAELQQVTDSITGGATFSVTPGFRALGGYVSFCGRTAESTAGSGNATGRFFLGAFVGTGSQHALGTRDASGAAGGVCTTFSSSGNSLVNITTDGAAGATAAVTAISATQVTWTQGTGDTGACLGFVVTFGDNEVPSPRQPWAIQQSWEPAGGLPFIQTKAVPVSAAPPSADWVPQRPRGFDVVNRSWDFPDPPAQRSPLLVQPGVVVVPDFVPRINRSLEIIRASWEPPPSDAQRGPNFTPSAPPPDFVPRTFRVLEVIRQSWEPGDPAPQKGPVTPQGAPPPGYVSRTLRVLEVIQVSWEPPPPMPWRGLPVPPPTAVVPVDFVTRAWRPMEWIVASWDPPDVTPYRPRAPVQPQEGPPAPTPPTPTTSRPDVSQFIKRVYR
jgi:hypothetical protein